MSNLIVAANRAPVTFSRDEAGVLSPQRGAGGMITISSALTGRNATWIAAAMSEGDREVASGGPVDVNGLDVRFLEFDEETFAGAYDRIANATLWFAHHGLFDRARNPVIDRSWWEAWDKYRAYNTAFSEVIAEVGDEGATVLVQDYHLALLGGQLAAKRPDLKTVHFSHTPFATPDALRVLPDSVVEELLQGMAGFHACGFHSQRWAGCFQSAFEDRGIGSAPALFVAPLVPASDEMAELERSDEGQAGAAWLSETVKGRRLVLRVDRIELSKNLIRGFLAFDELLEVRPDLRGVAVFVALVYPSRENLDVYVEYRNDVEATVERINARWRTPDWEPIVFDPSDAPERSAAALARYDVLLVNPLRDGLNLVAMEGPVLNTVDGVLALSHEAGAWDEMQGGALEVNPFDVSGTARVLADALDMEPAERATRAKTLRAAASRRSPSDWLETVMSSAGR
ncbi:MAG TPA: trehalose-6-phosphate synthase [Acidimicrobiales bacterium]|nr:trehalose-6-phosphate synthase [Acidimicrobiales bacterium]